MALTPQPSERESSLLAEIESLKREINFLREQAGQGGSRSIASVEKKQKKTVDMRSNPSLDLKKPGDPDTLVPDLIKKAQALSESGALREALQTYSGIIHDYPNHALAPAAHYEMGKNYQSLGELELAIREWSYVSKKYPYSPWCPEALTEKILAERGQKKMQQAKFTEEQLRTLFPLAPSLKRLESVNPTPATVELADENS